MKKLSLIFLSVLLVFTLAACGKKCEHTYDNACDAICNQCEETREVGAHDFAAADCDTAKTCKNCGVTEGEALGHTWGEADCDTAKTCTVCGATDGNALGHSFADADCTTAKTCTVCGATEGEVLGHTWVNATCTAPKTCSVCQATEGEALGHTAEADDGNCTTDIKCATCGTVLTSGKTQHVAHADDGDCTTPVTCTACSTVVTEAKSHDFSEAWTNDASGHWHVCKNDGCSVTDTKTDHISDGSATEEKAEKCTVCEFVIAPELEHTHEYSIPNKDATNHWNECRCGDKKDVTPHSANNDNDCTTADVCSCGHTVRAAHDHTPGKDDGNCTTEIKCTECGKTAVAGATDHNDTDHDYICDNGDCQITLDGAPKDENEGIDLPLVPNN